jgi:branched-chain amino acid transport system permease protein
MSLDTFLQQFLNAMQWGSYYALIAVGYSMVYGVLLLINFAHGDIFMVGAFAGFFIGTFAISQLGDMPPWLIAPVTLLAMLTTAVLAVTIERVAYRPLRRRGAHRLYLVITALMIGIFLEYSVLGIFGTRDLQFPALIQTQTFSIGPVIASNKGLLVILLALLVMALLWFIVQNTKWGMAMRAISYDRQVVPLMGISVDQIIVITFIIGGAMAGLAGVMFALSYPILRFNMGLLVGWKAFIAAVVGGIGSIRGAALGGYLFGFLEIFVAASLPSTYRDLILFSLLLLILVIRPTGIFGVARRTKV